jgi:hypothetical protein
VEDKPDCHSPRSFEYGDVAVDFGLGIRLASHLSEEPAASQPSSVAHSPRIRTVGCQNWKWRHTYVFLLQVDMLSHVQLVMHEVRRVLGGVIASMRGEGG